MPSSEAVRGLESKSMLFCRGFTVLTLCHLWFSVTIDLCCSHLCLLSRSSNDTQVRACCKHPMLYGSNSKACRRGPANFVLQFGITNSEPKLKVYIGHAQTMDPDRVGFVGILKCCVKEGRAFVVQHKPFHSQLGVAYLLFQIADLNIRKESNMAPRIWPFSSIQRQIEYGH